MPYIGPSFDSTVSEFQLGGKLEIPARGRPQKYMKGGTNLKMEFDEKLKAKADLYTGLARYIAPRVDVGFGVAVLQEIGRDLRCERLNMNSRNGNNVKNTDNDPATTKQIDYLKSLGVDVIHGMTKKQASGLIEDAKKVHELTLETIKK